LIAILKNIHFGPCWKTLSAVTSTECDPIEIERLCAFISGKSQNGEDSDRLERVEPPTVAVFHTGGEQEQRHDHVMRSGCLAGMHHCHRSGREKFFPR
jgi:hypothetical protein